MPGPRRAARPLTARARVERRLEVRFVSPSDRKTRHTDLATWRRMCGPAAASQGRELSAARLACPCRRSFAADHLPVAAQVSCRINHSRSPAQSEGRPTDLPARSAGAPRVAVDMENGL